MSAQRNRQYPTPPEILALRRLGYALAGGRNGCPRRRFFPLMVGASVLLYLAYPLLVGELMPAPDMQGPAFDMSLADIPFMLALVLGMLGAALSQGVIASLSGWLLSTTGLMLPAFENPALNIYLGGCVVMLTGLLSLVLACRRLKDAGRSRWNLLASLSYALVLLPLGGGVLAVLLSNLGGFWLLYLYTRPTCKAELPPPPPEP